MMCRNCSTALDFFDNTVSF